MNLIHGDYIFNLFFQDGVKKFGGKGGDKVRNIYLKEIL